MKRTICRLLLFLSVFALSAESVAVMAQDGKGTAAADTLDLCYRQVSRADYNGSVYVIKGDDLLTSATTYLTEDLMGIVPGLVMRQSEGGLDGANASYWIRGIRSFSNGVLVLVDGQERAFAGLTAEEVESIQVMKDAVAVGMYGMRASNGALLVTTKKGVQGKPQVDLAVQMINQDPQDSYEPLGAYEYAKHYRNAQLFDGANPSYSEYDLYNYKAGKGGNSYPDVAWRDKYFKKSWMLQRYNLNIKGGLKNATYFVNFGYLHQPGMFNTDNDLGYNTNNDADRYNYRTNINVDVSRTTKLFIDVYGWLKKQNMPYNDTPGIYNLLSVTPANAFPEYYEWAEGDANQTGALITPIGGVLVAQNKYNTNPWARLNRNGYSRAMSMYGSLSTMLRQDLSIFTEGLYAMAKISFDSQTNSRIQRTRGYAYYEPLAAGTYTMTGTDGKLTNTVENKSGNRLMTIIAQVGYDRSFGKNNVSSAVYYDQTEDTNDNGVPTRFQGVSAYASYNFDHRYGIDVTAARQGWCGFPKGHKFGFFPTVAAGWTISNEEFLKGSDIVNFLKLRASFGKLGSVRGVDSFSFKPRLVQEAAVAIIGAQMNQKLAGYYEEQMANPTLTWEKVTQYDAGIDASLFGNRLSLTADWFYDVRSDIFTSNGNLSTLFGFNANTGTSSNIGAMRSTGFEGAVSWKDHIGDFRYRIGGNFTLWRDVVDENGTADEFYPYLDSKGYPRGRKLGWIAEGIFQSYHEIAGHATQSWNAVKPGDIKYKDVNGDGVIDNDDRVPLGYSDTPGIFYGFNVALAYKGFSLNALFQGAANVTHSLDTPDFAPFQGNATMFAHETGYWTPENNANTLPRTTLGANISNNSVASTYNVIDADYLRLKRVELAYTLPDRLFDGIFLSGACVYLSGYNLLTWTKYPYGDPEYSTGLASMPMTRNVSLGCRIKF